MKLTCAICFLTKVSTWWGKTCILRHKHCLPCKHASYGYKCQEHDGLKVKREGKLREGKKIKGVYALVSTKDSTSDCNLWWTFGNTNPQQKN